jgi:choline dehydrogenase-like flavoprotein
MSSGHCQNVDFSILGGSITLASNNPFEAPNIDPGLLNSEFDVFTMRQAVRSAQRFLSAKAWADYVLAPFGDLANVTSDAELDKYIRANTATIFHPVGTAAMSPKGAKWGVVDPDLRVKGTMGLRVVDASVLVNFITLLSEWAVTFFF